jgi:hypothetical protein
MNRRPDLIDVAQRLFSILCMCFPPTLQCTAVWDVALDSLSLMVPFSGTLGSAKTLMRVLLIVFAVVPVRLSRAY